LDALLEVLPPLTDQDLAVVHRKNAKGVWVDELWTRRAMKVGECVLAPISSKLKESHFTQGAHSALGLPKAGRGAHPGTGSKAALALDGSSRTCIAKKGSLDDDEHLGNLFWLVGRSSKPSECNMSFEPVAWEYKVEITLPLQKKRKIDPVTWKNKELPTISVLVNKKELLKHTQLVAFEAPAVRPDARKK